MVDFAKHLKKNPKAPGKLSDRVQARQVSNAVTLIDIGPKHPLWKSYESCAQEGDTRIEKGAIYRITPPVDAEDATVDAFKKVLLAHGAVAVRIGVRRRSGVLAPEEKKPDEPRRSAREVIVQMVEESHVEDRDALRKTVEETMGRVGL